MFETRTKTKKGSLERIVRRNLKIKVGESLRLDLLDVRVLLIEPTLFRRILRMRRRLVIKSRSNLYAPALT